MTQWRHTIKLGDVFTGFDKHDPEAFIGARDTITKRIREAKFWDTEDFELVGVVEALEQSEDLSEFHDYWSQFYDWADFNLVWVETW